MSSVDRTLELIAAKEAEHAREVAAVSRVWTKLRRRFAGYADLHGVEMWELDDFFYDTDGDD